MTAPTIDPVIPAEQPHRSGIAKWIRRLAVPIILGWIGLIVVLTLTVPSLEKVGEMQVGVDVAQGSAVGGRDDARRQGLPGVRFRQLGNDRPGGRPAARRGGAPVLRRHDRQARADTKHVQHIQDFWGDPLTSAGAQSEDGKAAYVQVYLAGNMGEALGNESVTAVQKLIAGLSPPPGVKVFVTGGPALQADQEIAGNASIRIIELVTVGVIVSMLLFFYRSIVTVLLVLVILVLGLSVTRGVVAFLGFHELIGLSTFATQLLVTLAIAATTDYAIFLIGRYQEARTVGEDRESAYLHDVPRHRPRGAGLGHDDRRRDILPIVHPIALLPDAGHSARGRNGRRSACGADSGARHHHGREPLRTIGTQARHADSVLAAPRRRRRPVARLDPDS